jgi:putative polyhydroxyalkanoic acid system protein
MKHSIAHDLGQARARQVADAAFQNYKERFSKYNPTAHWKNDRSCEIAFTVKGMTLRGSVDVTPSNIEMDLDVPFLLRPFKGTALGVIEDEIKKWVTKAKAGEI